MRKVTLFIFTFIAFCIFQIAMAGTGAFPKGNDIFQLKDNIRFKSDNVRIMTGDTDDPTAVAKTADEGSIYIQNGTGVMFQKQDAGSSVNWQMLLIGAPGAGTDECSARWDGTGVPQLQDSLFCITDLGVGTGLIQIDVGNISISGNTISSLDANGNITLDPNGTGKVIVDSDLDVLGTITHISQTSLDVTNATITVNDTGNQATADSNDAGLIVEMSDATDTQIGYDSTTASKWIAGEVGSLAEVATVSHTQTLTNKSIDADANTITNIENADIKVGAAIDRAKLASGTADHVLINSGAGVMSSEAQLAASRGGTGIDTSASTGIPALAAGVWSVSALSAGISTALSDETGTGVLVFNNTPTLLTPTIADFTNSTHDHEDAAGGGQLDLTAAVSGVLPIANGGTNSSTALSNSLVMESVAGAIVESTTTSAELDLLNSRTYIPDAAGADNQVATFDGTNSIDSDANFTNVNGAVGITGDLDVDNLNLNGNTIISTDVGGDVAIDPNGTGEFSLVTLGGGQTYNLYSHATNNLSFQGQSASTVSGYDFFTADGDGTDAISMTLYNLGVPNTGGNTEGLQIRNAGAANWRIASLTSGGTVRPLELLTGANTNQLLLNTDGSVFLSGALNLDSLTASGVLTLDSSKDVVSTALTNGQIVMGSTGADPVIGSLTGTANQITVTPGAGSITLSTPQDIHTGASPTFTAQTLSAGPLNLEAAGELRLQDTAGGEYMAFKAPGTVTASTTFTLPDGDGEDGQVLKTDGSGVLSWDSSATSPTSSTISYTPAFVGFGTATNISFEYQRVGDRLRVNGRFASGNPTAVEARIGLPIIDGQQLAIGSQQGSLRYAGFGFRANGTASTDKEFSVLSTAGEEYVTVGYLHYTPATNPTTEQNGNGIISNGEFAYFDFEVPIQGWQSSADVITQAGFKASSIYWSNVTSCQHDITSGTFTTFADATNCLFSDADTIGSAVVPSTDGNIALKIPTLPPGVYEVTATGRMAVGNAISHTCVFELDDGTNHIGTTSISTGAGDFQSFNSLGGLIEITSTQTDYEVALKGKRTVGASVGCGIIASTDNSIGISIKPYYGVIQADLKINMSAQEDIDSAAIPTGVNRYLDFPTAVESGNFTGCGSGHVATSGTGCKFVATKAEWHTVKSKITFNDADWDSGELVIFNVMVNNVAKCSERRSQDASSGASLVFTLANNCNVKLAVGDEVEMRVDHSAGADLSFQTGAIHNWFQVQQL